MTAARALLSWLALLAVAFSNGALRELTVRRWLAEPVANRVSVGWGCTFLGVAIWILTRRWPLGSYRQAFRLGALWTALTLAFEFGMGLVQGASWERMLHEYEIWNGRLWPLVVVFVLLAPALALALELALRDRPGAAPGALLWAVAAWMACGATMGVATALLGLDVALVVHAAAAPFIAFGATAAYRRRSGPRLGALATAALVVLVPVHLDALVIAPVVVRSFAMFESAIGTWIPFALLFLGSLAASRLVPAPGARAAR